jgi:acetyltransferase-like isoleucine patch superfamily enzyme
MIRSLLGRLFHFVAFFGPGGHNLRPWMHRLRGVHIGKNVWISHFVYIDDCHPNQISIGDNCTIGLRTTIFAHLYWGPARRSNKDAVVLEKDVFVGPHCVILPNVRIGEGAVIKAGTVVSRNVPAHALWGPPAPGVLGDATVPLTAEHTYEEFVRGMRLHPKAGSRSHEAMTELRR